MKEINARIYEAYDGKLFFTAEECKTYENDNYLHRLVGLTMEQILAASSRSDASLAEAFEKIGTQIANDRREAGEFKKRSTRRNQAETQQETAPPSPPETEPEPHHPFTAPDIIASTHPLDEAAGADEKLQTA